MSPKATNFFYSVLAPILGKKSFQFVFEMLYLFSLAGMNYGQAMPQASGEKQLLNYIKTKLQKKRNIVIFDVGANKGEFTNLLLKIFEKRITVFAFEPLSSAFAILKERFEKEKKVKKINAALSDITSNQYIYFNEDLSELSSLYHRKNKSMSLPSELNKKEKIKLITLDSICQKYDIETIDLLKIDAEGNELKILKGAKKTLKQGRISYIQFEFGGTMVDSRTFFRDLYLLLNPDYKIYRVLQDGFRLIDKYAEKHEIFIVCNFFAVRRDLKSQ